MKHFRTKVVITVLLAAGFIVAFSWIVAWQCSIRLSAEASKEKPLTKEAVRYTLDNLSRAWDDYDARVTKRFEVETVFASLALQSVAEDGSIPEEETLENTAVINVEDGKLDTSVSAVGTLGLNASLFQKNKGSFAAPNDPSTFVAYSKIGGTSAFYVKWWEDTVIDDIVRDSIDIPGIMKRTEVSYDVSAMFVLLDPVSGDFSDILYKNERSFSTCENFDELGLTREYLEQNDGQKAKRLTYNGDNFSYVSGKSEAPAGYVILFDPVPNLFSMAFAQEGYMIATLFILLSILLVTGFSVYTFVHNNVLTPEEEKSYLPSHVRSMVTLFGIGGLVLIAISGMFGYALNGLYEDAIRGETRLDMLDDSISMYTERYTQNLESFHDVYLDYGNNIARLLDTYPELRDSSVLKTVAESIAASSITLYDSNGRETKSSDPWVDLELSTDPASTTYDFRRILKGVPYIIHDPEIDEVTGLNEMRIAIRIRDDLSQDRHGAMILSVNITDLTNHDIDPELSVKQILSNLSDSETNLWITDAETGKILVYGKEKPEDEYIPVSVPAESDLNGTLMKAMQTEEGDFFITYAPMETPGILAWTGASDNIVAYYKGPKTSLLPGIVSFTLTGCILFAIIYGILAWMIFADYTDDFLNTYKQVKGCDDPNRKLSAFRRVLVSITPVRRGVIAMEAATAFIIVQMVPILNLNAALVRNTVYKYIYSGDWERGFNLFAFAQVLVLLSEAVLFVIAVRLVTTVCSTFSGAKGKTIFRLIANIVLYITVLYIIIKTLEYLGFSSTAIAAGMGSLALAVSLGAQNFVADIFAGLTFVFEGTIHVGDIVKITSSGSAPFQGKVMEIGVRCIKVLTREGDLITCSNRDIRTIKNSTQMNTRVICELVISSEISAVEVELILNRELPLIGQTDRQILSGPTYNGITSIGNGTMTLSVSAECREEDYFYVRDKMNVSLQRIFREHGYTI